MTTLQAINFEIDFSFTSPMRNDNDPTDFVNEVQFNILITDDEDNREVIGKGMFSLILLERAVNKNIDLHLVMDATSAIDEISELLDLDNYIGLFEKIEAFMPDEEPIFNSNIALLERIEILPKYRGLGISTMTIKRIAEQFYGWFDLMIIKAYPLQFDNTINIDNDKWSTAMNYSELTDNFDKSQKKLFKLYSKMGFENFFDDEFFISRSNKIIS